MIRIGLIGENQNDSKAIKHLLEQKYSLGFHYAVLLKNVTGNHLDTPKAGKAIVAEVAWQNIDMVIMIRDSDAPQSDTVAIKKQQDWYNNLSKQIDKQTMLLLNIYELEALILADIESFNAYYKCKVKFTGNVSHKDDPKEFLKKESARKYKESECPDLFKALKIDTIAKNCTYFKNFITAFEQAVKN